MFTLETGTSLGCSITTTWLFAKKNLRQFFHNCLSNPTNGQMIRLSDLGDVVNVLLMDNCCNADGFDVTNDTYVNGNLDCKYDF